MYLCAAKNKNWKKYTLLDNMGILQERLAKYDRPQKYKKLGIYPYFLTMTMAEWNEAVATQNDADFGRTTGMNDSLTTPPYYAIKIAPGIHHTMGGVKIDTSAEVIDVNGNPIPGLFAAGEVTGGVHGGNRLGGNAVADIVIFGRIAAESAIEYIGK